MAFNGMSIKYNVSFTFIYDYSTLARIVPMMITYDCKLKFLLAAFFLSLRVFLVVIQKSIYINK